MRSLALLLNQQFVNVSSCFVVVCETVSRIAMGILPILTEFSVLLLSDSRLMLR
jgi:hypothetical protein